MSTLLFSCGTIAFKPLALYDEVEVVSEEDQEEKSDPIIYEDGTGTMWNSLFECGEFEIVKDVYYSGNSAIKISWDKGKGCDWIGFGNSFNNWAPADMSKDRLTKALSFYVRTQSSVSGGIPIVAALEDFAGGGTYLFTDAKQYLFGLTIDTTWKQMIVPMWHFPVGSEAGNDDVDISSIKQMQFQLEGAGKFYLDEIKLIDYSQEQYDQMLAAKEEMKPKGNINQTVYLGGTLNNDAWGVGEKFCHTLKESIDSTGNTFISWDFKVEDCNWAKWGINWNDWYPINFRGITEDAMIQFKLKTSSSADFNIVLKDFKGHSSILYSSFSTGSEESDWNTINIKLKDFNLKAKGFELDQIREIGFEGKTSGTVLIDDIKIMDSWEY